MKKREFQVALASFAITAMLLAGVWGLIRVDLHSRRYGVGVSTPAITARLQEPLRLEMAILGHERAISLESINQLQGLMHSANSFIPRPLRLAGVLNAQVRAAYETYQVMLREREFKEYLLTEGF